MTLASQIGDNAAFAASLGAFLTLDEAVRVVLSSRALYLGGGGGGGRALLKVALLAGGCPPHLRTRCVVCADQHLSPAQSPPPR